jgi:hypothetical protein
MPFEVAMVLIVAIVAFSRIFRERYRAQGRSRLDAQQGLQALLPRTDPALEREVADLRKRLEVLERIATEDRKTHQLADEIERLR